jgi:hypothetical protein
MVFEEQLDDSVAAHVRLAGGVTWQWILATSTAVSVPKEITTAVRGLVRRHYKGANVAASTGGRGVRPSRSTDSPLTTPGAPRRAPRPATPIAGGSPVETTTSAAPSSPSVQM